MSLTECMLGLKKYSTTVVIIWTTTVYSKAMLQPSLLEFRLLPGVHMLPAL